MSGTLKQRTDSSGDTCPIVNIAAYKFVALQDLQVLRDQLRKLCYRLGLKGTILLSPEGINMFLAGEREAMDEFLAHIRSYEYFADLEVKESFSQEQPFHRMLVKLKREIIAFGIDGIEPARRTSPKLNAQQLKQWLDEGRPVRLLDVRNDYEFDLGTFDGAEQLNIHNFRDFPKAIAQLPTEARQQPLVMFCTGGIRCEKAGPLMEQAGFEQVYQLDGGILKYFEECGSAHYHGGCFVFDSRVVLDPQLQSTGAVLCFACQSVLSHEDIQSEKFQYGKSCPHCYKTPAEQQAEQLRKRENELREIAQSQPGCTPYDNRRIMFVPKRSAGKTVLEFLREFHPPTAEQQWLSWLAEHSITRRNEPVSSDAIVSEGERFEQIEKNYTEPPIATDIRLLYEDEFLIVVDKPAPLPVHPGGRYNRNTLLGLLSEVYRPEKLRVAHRLDANTAGLIVLCRKYASSRVLQPKFATHEIDKRYLLKVWGHPSEDAFECRAPISTEPVALGAREVDSEGQAAVTQFIVRERCNDGTSILEARPVTGRTHQIRLHAWHLGMPIVGDPLYLRGGEKGTQATLGVEETPLSLLAWQLFFDHPITGERLSFESQRAL